MKAPPCPPMMAMVFWWSYPFCVESISGHELAGGCRIGTCIPWSVSAGRPPLALLAYSYYVAAFELAFGPGWTLYAQQAANGMHSIKVRSYEN